MAALSSRNMVIDMKTIDDGAPVYDPHTQTIQLDWRETEVDVESIDGTMRKELVKLATYSIVPHALEAVKATLQARVDADAENVRLRHITPGSGMALTYKEKQEQAHAVLDMGEEAANALPDNGAQSFPILAASVGIEAATLHAVAQLVWQKFETFNALAFVIERTRLAGKKSISDASDAASAKAAYEAITWAV